MKEKDESIISRYLTLMFDTEDDFARKLFFVNIVNQMAEESRS